jgi:hypothetical protein
MRPLEAINAGYDEITHINWIVMQAMPDKVVEESNGIQRFEGPGRYAKDLDLDAGPIQTLISTMAAKGIYSDPTMVAFEGLYVPENGELSPSYSAFVGTLPPATERSFRVGGFQVPKDLTRADYRASWAKMVELLNRMHKAGVPIVAGTDGVGVELVHELRDLRGSRVHAGEALIIRCHHCPGQTLSTRTEHRFHQARRGRRPRARRGRSLEKRIADLRQTRTVMLGGKLLDADALRSAAGSRQAEVMDDASPLLRGDALLFQDFLEILAARELRRTFSPCTTACARVSLPWSFLTR